MTTLKDKLEPQEAKIIELKYSGKPFGQLSEDERWFAAKTLILKIHTVTGWTIPVSELMDILIDQFQRKLQESYAKVTVAEVEYAFRNRGIDIKDWGKALNLTMIDEVMIPYLETRFELSRMEESIKKPVMIANEVTETDEEKAQWLMDWKVKKDINIDLIPLSFYDFIIEKELVKITNDDKRGYADRAATYIKYNLQAELGICKTNDAYIAYNKFCNMESEGFEGDFKTRIVNRAKKLVVFDYLKGMFDNQIN